MTSSSFSPPDGPVTDNQQAVIDFLQDPKSHGPGVTSVERIDTHISVIFLAGERAYKLRRAVKLAYVDFTSLEDRRKDCEREIEFNRLGAPTLYEGVEPVIRSTTGKLSLGGTGEPVDWLVVMRRFQQSDRFDLRLEAGKLERHAMCDLAERIWSVHDTGPVIRGSGWLGNFKTILDSNRRAFEPFTGTLFAEDRIERYFSRIDQTVSALSLCLEERGHEGFVRRCHGDLHLANIVQFDGAPALFDSLEFNDLFALIDRLYDLSFVLMDLDFRGERRLASIMFNHYMEYAGDTAGCALMPLYLSTRASIRAFVAATAAGEQTVAAESRELEEQAVGYMDLAESYLDPDPKRIVAVGGLSGSGKSRLAREVAPHLGAPGALVLRTDVLRKRLAGRQPYSGLGPEGYTKAMTVKTYDLLFEEARQALAIGRTVVLDGVFAKPEERARAEALAAHLGVPFAGLWVEAPIAVAQDRIAQRIRNPSDVDRAVRQKQESFDLGAITWTKIDSSGPKEDTVAAGLAALGV